MDVLRRNDNGEEAGNFSVDHKGSRSTRFRSQGAEVVDGGVRYRTWCKCDRADVLIFRADGSVLRTVRLEAEGSDYFSAIDEAGKAGDLYKYRLDEGQAWPDPASRYQPDEVHGPSMVIDPTYAWTDSIWVPPPFSELIVYELHVGAFTPAGTFRSAMDRMAHLAALGVTAIELMPLGDFPGERNWGYDGVMLYAPARAYGTPDDLRALVDAAHAEGLAVILDVVYNHLGPDGNYTGVYHKDYYSNPRRETPWGAGFNYADPSVRAFFVENAHYWMREFHIDGFRLDATHAITDESDRPILAEITATVHELGGFVVAEDERNDPMVLTPESGGGWGFDGVWADDFHHVIRVLLTREREGYYANFHGDSNELAQTLAHGWLFRGQTQSTNGEARGGDTSGCAPQQFVYCISNHDQVGNRAFGERLNHSTSPAAYRAASALLCLVPQTPLLFMGQEWAASTPFQYFTDHEPKLGKAITSGRRREFQNFSAFRDPDALCKIPDPQSSETFLNSKLRWDEITESKHAGVLLLYWEFLELRKTHPAFRSPMRENCTTIDLGEGVVAMLFGQGGRFDCLVLSDLIGGHRERNLDHPRLVPGGGRDWKLLLCSNDARFAGGSSPDPGSPETAVFEPI
ncbi:MAG: maltooligosyltrehalose trehalohydrolase [Verrucomicrobiota bacterium]